MSEKSLTNTVARLQKIAGERKAKKEAGWIPNKDSELSQARLPMWPDGTRGVPNAVLRSAVFGAIQPGRRKVFKDEPIIAQDGVKILFTGDQLDQADLDVWEQVLQLVRENNAISDTIKFSSSGFLKAIGRKCSNGKAGGKDTKWLHKSLRRLVDARLDLKERSSGCEYYGPMVLDVAHQESTGLFVVNVNPKIAQLYTAESFSLVDWEIRLSLDKSLAKWLHGYYCSHSKPHPIYVETILKMCGSSTTDVPGFKRNLIMAMNDLCSKTGWQYSISTDNLVTVTKKPKPSEVKKMFKGMGKAISQRSG